MRSLFYILSLLLVVFLLGCEDVPTFPTAYAGYFPLSKGSTWVYKNSDGSIDTLVAVEEFDVTTGGKGAFIRGNDSSISMYWRDGNKIYTQVLKDSLSYQSTAWLIEESGATWQYSFKSTSLKSTFSYTGKEMGLTRTVLSKTYQDVFHVHIVVNDTINGFPGSGTIDEYYAKGIGLIEIIDNAGDYGQLVSYTIK